MATGQDGFSSVASRGPPTMLSEDFIQRFTEVAKSPAPDLAPAAFLISRLEYPRLDTSSYLDRLDRMGEEAKLRIRALGEDADPAYRISAISTYLFKEQGFAGNRKYYDDPRNSFLNDVLDRRTGIPITLALVYMEVSRRAGVPIDGVNFPGHFLLKSPPRPGGSDGGISHVIVDPFHDGAILSEDDCESLLQQYAGNDMAFDPRLLARATKQEILIRMLVNLKQIYVKLRSFPQAHAITRLLLGLNPSAITELRDRGLLAYHLNNYQAALQDLEAYLRFTTRREETDTEDDEDGESEGQDEQSEIWEHVKALRRRVASLN